MTTQHEPISTIYENLGEDGGKPGVERYPTIEEVLSDRKRLHPEAGELKTKECKSEALMKAKQNIGNYRFTLTHKTSIDTNIPTVLSADWSENGELLGVCGDEGAVHVFTRNGETAYKMKPNNSGLPTTCVKWRPRSESLGSLQVLISVDVTGQIVHWHVPTEKEIYRTQEEDNQIYSVQYRSDGEQFATTGRDCCVRVYDEHTKSKLLTLDKGESMCVGHSNRVFATAFKPDNSNILVSGGWDNTLIIWDLRAGGEPTNTIYGPHLAGQSLDIQNDTIITGSWRNKDVLESWDMKTGKKIRTIGDQVTPKVYTAYFQGTAAGLFVAGGASEVASHNSLRLYDLDAGETSNAVHLSNKRGIYASCVNRHSEIAVAGNSQYVEIFKM